MFVYGKVSADNGREPRRLRIGRRKLLRISIKMSRCSMGPSLSVGKIGRGATVHAPHLSCQSLRRARRPARGPWILGIPSAPHRPSRPRDGS